MIGCSSIFQRYFMEHAGYEDLNIAYLDTSENFGIAVSRGESILVEILNKAIRQMDNTVLTSAMVQYSNVEVSYTFIEFIRHYSIGVIAVLCVFFSILLRMYISFRRKTKFFNEEQAKTRAALEDALRAANVASDAKTSFLSSMSHDIRTPLNGIIGMTAIAGAHMDDPSRVQDCLMKITSSGKHLLALINEVLDMAKIESGEITNLVSNAIKYTPAGGEIEITLSEKPSGSPKLGRFEFMVQDNGIGMSEDYLPHVFEAFTRADNASVAHIQGTGGYPL